MDGSEGGGEAWKEAGAVWTSTFPSSALWLRGVLVLRAFQRPFSPSTVFSTFADPAAKTLDMASLVGANC